MSFGFFVWFFCSTDVCNVALYGCLPFLSCAYRIGATLCLCFVFLILRLHSEHCLCLSFMCCFSRFIATPSLIFSAILRALPLHFFASRCFAFAFLCLFFTSRSFSFALMMLIDALPVETTFAAVSPLAEAFHLAIVKTVAQYRPER